MSQDVSQLRAHETMHKFNRHTTRENDTCCVQRLHTLRPTRRGQNTTRIMLTASRVTVRRIQTQDPRFSAIWCFFFIFLFFEFFDHWKIIVTTKQNQNQNNRQWPRPGPDPAQTRPKPGLAQPGPFIFSCFCFSLMFFNFVHFL